MPATSTIGGSAGCRAAAERTQAQHQLAQRERLREVVVGAALEAGRLVVEAVRRREHQDARAGRLGGEVPGDLVAVRARDVAVEHDHVVGVDRELLQRGVAVAGDVGGDRLETQPIADRLGEVELVLDDQHAHAPPA